MEDLEVTGMRVKREPRPKERGAPVVVGKALKLARRMRISILRDGFLFVFTVTGSPRVGRFAADEVGGGDNVDEQEHCEWGILLEEASWKILALIYFHFAAISDTPVNNLTLLYKDFLFLLPSLTNCVSGRYLVRRNLLLREEPFLEGSLIFSSPPQGYPSWEGPLFKLKRTWCIFAIIVLPTTYTSTTTVANEICSLCLLCTGVCTCIREKNQNNQQLRQNENISNFVQPRLMEIVLHPSKGASHCLGPVTKRILSREHQ